MKKLAILMTVVVLFTGCLSGTEEDPNTSGISYNEVSDVVAPALTAEECFNNTIFHEVEGTTIKFCYKEQWGAPSVDSESLAIVNKTRIYFANSDTVSTPEIVYLTGEFPVDSEIEHFAYENMNPAMSEDFLHGWVADSLGLTKEEVNVRKVTVDDKKAVRVNNYSTNVLSYYVPEAWTGAHLELFAPNEIAAELDDMAQLMIGF